MARRRVVRHDGALRDLTGITDFVPDPPAEVRAASIRRQASQIVGFWQKVANSNYVECAKMIEGIDKIMQQSQELMQTSGTDLLQTVIEQSGQMKETLVGVLQDMTQLDAVQESFDQDPNAGPITNGQSVMPTEGEPVMPIASRCRVAGWDGQPRPEIVEATMQALSQGERPLEEVGGELQQRGWPVEDVEKAFDEGLEKGLWDMSKKGMDLWLSLSPQVSTGRRKRAMEDAWTCPNCGAVNGGPETYPGGDPNPQTEKCRRCGEPKPTEGEPVMPTARRRQAQENETTTCPFCGSQNATLVPGTGDWTSGRPPYEGTGYTEGRCPDCGKTWQHEDGTRNAKLAQDAPNVDFGQPYGGDDPSFETPQGPVWMFRKGQAVRFYDQQGQQVGPEQNNVAPAIAYAMSEGWKDLVGPEMSYSGKAGALHKRGQPETCPNCGSSDYSESYNGETIEPTSGAIWPPPYWSGEMKCNNCGHVWQALTDDEVDDMAADLRAFTGARYEGDPRWITTKYPATCVKCNRQIAQGEEVFYYPNGKQIYCNQDGCGGDASRDFDATSFDEDFGSFGAKTIGPSTR